MSNLLGYVQGFPILETRTNHAPAGSSNGGQFVKGGSLEHEHHDVHGNVLSKESDKQLSRHFGQPVSMHDLAQAISGGSHFKVSIEKLDFGSERAKGLGGFEVVAVIHDHGSRVKPRSQQTTEEKKQTGVIKYVFSKDMHPKDQSKDVHSVEHHVIDLPKHLQGQGGAKEMLRNSQFFYDKHGVDKIHLEAGLEMGRYAWPRMGFSAKPKDVEIYRKAFMQHLTDRGMHTEALEASKIKNMHEIADFKSADGHRQGKDFLIRAGDESSKGPSLPRFKASVTRGKPDWKRYEAALKS